MKIKVEHQDNTLRVRADHDHMKNIVENSVLASLECVSLADIPSDEKILSISWVTVDNALRISIKNPLEQYVEDRGENFLPEVGISHGGAHSPIRMQYLYWAVSIMLLKEYKEELYARPIKEGGVDTHLTFEIEQMQASPSVKLPIGGLSLATTSAPFKAVKELPKKLSILVAEDDPLARGLMTTVLGLMGQELTFATNGREVLDYVSQSQVYDVILMDIDMPIMDGLRATQALRHGEVGEFGTKVPIVAVTAFCSISDESKFRDAGMNYFLPKPVRLKSLREVLLDVIRDMDGVSN